MQGRYFSDDVQRHGDEHQRLQRREEGGHKERDLQDDPALFLLLLGTFIPKNFSCVPVSCSPAFLPRGSLGGLQYVNNKFNELV